METHFFKTQMNRKCVSEEQTKAFAEEFSYFLKKGDIVILSGPLGAGKTCFVKGIARAFGISEEEVTSPSFKLLNQYSSSGLEIYHFDFYRLHYENGFPMFEWDDITETGIAIIEWGDHWEGPSNYFVSITVDDIVRNIVIKRTIE